MSRLRLLIPLVCTFALGGAPCAFAQEEDGVFVDPDAPTSKEYAIPLEDARRDAAGGEKKLGPQAQGERSAPLFGEGVGSEGDEDDAAPAAGGGSDGGGSSGGGRDKESSGTGGGSPERNDDLGTSSPEIERSGGSRTRQAEAPDGGIGAGVTIGALALSVLLLGGVLGSIVRRRGGGATAS